MWVFIWLWSCMRFIPAQAVGPRNGLTHFSRRPVAVLPDVAISHSSMASPVLGLLCSHMNTLALRCKRLCEVQGQRWENLHSLGMTNICASHQGRPELLAFSLSLFLETQRLHHPHCCSNWCLSNAPEDFHPGLNVGQEQTRDSSSQEVGTDQSSSRFL